MEKIFEWKRMLMNDLPFEFLFEVLFRSGVMFIILLFTLRLTGKRGVKQLSIFETVLIIALGSAAGDPMFYEDVGILPALTVFAIVMLMYRFVTWLTAKSKRFEELVEGKTECLISEGKFSISTFEKEDLAHDEFFSELRVKSVEHLGQVRHAYLEPSGELSLYFYADEEVGYGLPIRPEIFNNKSAYIPEPGIYSCAFCGNTEEKQPGTGSCSDCGKDQWVASINSRRIA